MGQVGLEGAFASCSAVADAGPWGVEAHLLLHLTGFPWLALEAGSHLMWGAQTLPLHRGLSSLWILRAQSLGYFLGLR